MNKFFLEDKKCCIHGVLMNNLPPMKNCPVVGERGRSYKFLGYSPGQNWVGGVTPMHQMCFIFFSDRILPLFMCLTFI